METIFENPGFRTSALVAIIFIITSLICMKYRPAKINWFVGYRTKSSMKSQERWDFAQAYWPSKMLTSGSLLLLVGFVFLFIEMEDQSALISAVALIMIAAFYPVLVTEKAIKEEFEP